MHASSLFVSFNLPSFWASSFTIIHTFYQFLRLNPHRFPLDSQKGGFMKHRYEHIHELAFISDRLKSVFDKYSGTEATNMPFKDVLAFRKRLRTWDKQFPHPPAVALANLRFESLQAFYAFKLDFSIFAGFSPEEQDIIRDEIATYATREALDFFIGYRLRNMADIGLVSRRWNIYLSKVKGYYDKVVPQEKKDRIAQFVKEISQLKGEYVQRIKSKSAGELFFEVDKIRLMSSRALKIYLEDMRQQIIAGKKRDTRIGAITPPPGTVRECLDYLGLSYPVELHALKSRYRELARVYHPDKGGSGNEMQQLNAAYRVVVRYILREARLIKREKAGKEIG